MISEVIGDLLVTSLMFQKSMKNAYMTKYIHTLKHFFQNITAVFVKDSKLKVQF